MAQCDSTSPFQKCSVHAQFSVWDRPRARHAGLAHGDFSLLADSAACVGTIGWLWRRDGTRFWITRCISSPAGGDGADRQLGVVAGRVAGVRKPSAGDRAQRRRRYVFRCPLGAATPARVFLTGHRCLTGAAQAWKMSFAHGPALDPESSRRSRRPLAQIGGGLFPRRGRNCSLARQRSGACAKSLRRSGKNLVAIDSIPFRTDPWAGSAT